MNNVTEDPPGLQGTTSVVTQLPNHPPFPELLAAVALWRAWTPCILVLGGFGNIATICVMRRIKDHNSSQHAFLLALAATDLGLLYSGAARHWIYHMLGVEVRDLHVLACKLLNWLVYSLNTASAWLLACVTVQRTLAVTWPHRMKALCTLKRTWIVIAAVVFSVGALHFHWLIGKAMSAEHACYYVSEAYKEFTMVWRWVDMCVSSIFPAVCLLVCDVVLALTLFKATSSAAVVSVHAISNSRTAQQISSRKKVASRTTLMILALSCTFLVLTLPVCVFLIWEHYADVYANTSSRLYAQAELLFAVTFLLWYTNSAINFLLYCFTGTKFRKEFLSWIRCGSKKDSSTAGKLGENSSKE